MLPSGHFPAFTPAKAGTLFSDSGGMQGWVDLGDSLHSNDYDVKPSSNFWTCFKIKLIRFLKLGLKVVRYFHLLTVDSAYNK